MNDEFDFDDKKEETLDDDIDVNRENEEMYKDLMDNAKVKTDGYWDRNNPTIKIILGVLLGIIIIGVIYYFIIGLKML